MHGSLPTSQAEGKAATRLQTSMRGKQVHAIN